MAKSINVHEICVITKDDKGNLSLVGKAKEALTSLQKHKVSVHILLCGNKKEDVEKFLNDNNVPFASVIEKTGDAGDKDVVTVVPSSKFITMRDDWKWCIDDIVHRLWGDKAKENPRSEQQAMDKAMDDYIKYTRPSKNVPVNGGTLG